MNSPFYYYLGAWSIVCLSSYVVYQRYFRARKREAKQDQPVIELYHNSIICSICLNEFKDTKETLSLPRCNHIACIDCLHSYVYMSMQDRESYPLKCFNSTECKEFIPEVFLFNGKLSIDREKYVKWTMQATKRKSILCHSCNMSMVVSQDDTCASYKCLACNFEWCSYCSEKKHGNDEICTLKLVEQERKISDELKLQLALEEGNIAKCPRCEVRIEKAGGCNYMTHKSCPRNNNSNVHFCYICECELHDTYHSYEKIGRDVLHFENGLFQPCKNYQIVQQQKLQRIESLKERLDSIHTTIELTQEIYSYKNCRLFPSNATAKQWVVWTKKWYHVYNSIRYTVNLYHTMEPTCECAKFKKNCLTKCKHIVAAEATRDKLIRLRRQ